MHASGYMNAYLKVSPWTWYSELDISLNMHYLDIMQ